MGISADLTGKTALVTGASSEGFGRFFAEVLGKAGAEVTVSARRRSRLDEVTTAIEQAGGRSHAVALDVTDLAAIQRLMEEHGPFDIIVNNAGVSVPKPILQQEDEDYDLVLGTNLKGVWNVAKEGARALKRAERPGSIINIASITGLRQADAITPYAVSKAAVIHMTKQMALEFARLGIRVNALAPGYFESDLTRAFFETERGRALIERIPMKRLGDYESLAGPLLLLADDASAFMTGAVITVDGGHVLSPL
jgi:NAD(P)-dependent dehydrogenase (short-subunit alcohol dehydrogenase family)